MVTQAVSILQPTSYGTAKRLRHHVESVPAAIMIVPNSIVMMTVVCEDCGEQFAVAHRHASRDADLAEKQAVWLTDRFVWDHIQEKKHPSSIRLPGLHEMPTIPPGR